MVTQSVTYWYRYMLTVISTWYTLFCEVRASLPAMYTGKVHVTARSSSTQKYYSNTYMIYTPGTSPRRTVLYFYLGFSTTLILHINGCDVTFRVRCYQTARTY